MQFALNENTISQCGFVDFIHAGRTAGFKAVEISYRKIQEALRFLPVGKLLDLLDEAGIVILSLNAFEDALLVPPSGLEIMETEARLIGRICELIRCPAVVVPSSRWYPEYGPVPERNEVTALFQERMLRIRHVLSEFNVVPMFEPIHYPEFLVGEAGWINQVLSAPGLDDVPLVVDIHNLFNNGDGPGQLENLSNPIGLVHIDDTLDIRSEERDVAASRTFPGDGIANASEWIRSAGNAGYTGYCSLELFSNSIYRMDPDEAAILCYRKLEAFGMVHTAGSPK